MKRLLLTLQFMFICIISLANENYPIIFVNGHSSGANAEAGVRHWNPSSGLNTAMTRIESQRYDGYQYGLKSDGDPAKDCDMNTNLNPTPDSKRIYNFSYYHPNGQRGVISLNDDSVLVYIKWVYDVLGRPIPAVIAPFDPNYPPSNYDSTTYYPKYSPHLSLQNIPGHGLMWIVKSVTSEYVKSWKKGKFAKRLSLFIDKVLSATGAPKVDIVAYSMGGLVARTAIKNYGCASKVRKLLMVGTPNHPYDRWWEDLYSAFWPDKSWQKMGENLEMGLSYYGGKTAYFLNLQNGNSKFWCKWLGYNNLIDEMVTIAGDKGEFYFGNVDNDGVVGVAQVHLNSAEPFNPVIFASHCYDGISEHALTTCTYTTEFIKVWMTDDETLPDIYFTSNDLFDPGAYLAYELNLNFSTNLGSENPWEPILSTSITMWNALGDTVLSKGYGWHTKGSEFEKCVSPVLCLSPDLFPVNVKYFANIRHQNMVDGDVRVNKPSVVVLDHGGPAAYVHFDIPSSEWTAGDKLEITNIDLGANDPDDTTYQYKWENGSYQDCEFDENGRWIIPYNSIPAPLQCVTLRSTVKLDPMTYLRAWKGGIVHSSAAPENVTLNYNGGAVKVSWDTMSDNDYYEIWWRELAKAESFTFTLRGTTNSSPYYDENFFEGDYSYRYKVRGNFTNFSNYKDISFYHLAPPTNLQAVFGDSIVILTWEDISSLNTGYEIKRKDVDSNLVYWSVGDVDSVIDDNVDPSKLPYIYWVRSFDGSGHISPWSDCSDHTPPSVNITSPGEYRVVYTGLFTIEWDASDDYGIDSQKLSFSHVFYNSINLDGNVRSQEVDFPLYGGAGIELEIRLEATDYAGNRRDDETYLVIIDPSQADIQLGWEHDDNWRVTIHTLNSTTFRRIYKGEGNNWERITFGMDLASWQDPDPLSEGETRSYLVCNGGFHHISDTITVHRPYDIHPCPVLYTFTGSSFELDNSLLPASEFTHQLTRDYYILKKKPQIKDGKYRFKIIEGLDNTYIDLIKLRIIEHPRDVKVGALPKGEVIAFRPSSLPYLTIDKEEKEGEVLKGVRGLKGWRDLKEGKDLMKGKAWKDSLVTEGSGYYYGKEGDYLDVLFSEKGDYLYSVLAKPKQGIAVRPGNIKPDIIYSRMNGSDILLPCTDSVIRFIPQDSLCRIDYVSKAVRLPDSLIREKEALAVDLPKELAKEDKEYYHLSPGDTLEFSFEAPDISSLSNRSYCLEVIGYYLPVGETVESKGPEEKGPEEIVYASYIKPASSLITGNLLLRASSNKRRMVKIEVIDPVGRILKRRDIRLSRGEEMINLGGFDSGIYFIKIFDNKDKVYKVTVIR